MPIFEGVDTELDMALLAVESLNNNLGLQVTKDAVSIMLEARGITITRAIKNGQAFNIRYIGTCYPNNNNRIYLEHYDQVVKENNEKDFEDPTRLTGFALNEEARKRMNNTLRVLKPV